MTWEKFYFAKNKKLLTRIICVFQQVSITWISTSFNPVDFNKFQSRGFQQVSDVKKLEALNALSLYFKQINDNLDSFTNSSSSNKHCTTMHTDLETFNCRKQRNFFKEESNVTFSKKKIEIFKIKI